MKQSQLISVVKKQLTDLAKRKDIEDPISEDTILNTVVSAKDGKGASNSKNIFRIAVAWTLHREQIKKAWPAGWDELSIKDFASRFFMIMLIIMGSFSAQSQLEITLGTSKTALRDNAIMIGLSYVKNLDSVFGNQDYLITGDKSGLLITPEAKLTTGNEDAFSSLVVKATGLLMYFKTQEVDGITTPDLSKTFHTFPMSLGVETNNLFNSINGIVEAGWVPWFSANNELTKKLNVGLYLQGGYKFGGDSLRIGGEKDESQESPNSAIFRVKGSIGIDTKSLLKISGLDIGLVGNADVWADVVNGAFYHRIEARGRFYTSPTNYIDLIYQKGSGAPNFNQGDQYGIGFTITL